MTALPDLKRFLCDRGNPESPCPTSLPTSPDSTRTPSTATRRIEGQVPSARNF